MRGSFVGHVQFAGCPMPRREEQAIWHRGVMGGHGMDEGHAMRAAENVDWAGRMRDAIPIRASSSVLCCFESTATASQTAAGS